METLQNKAELILEYEKRMSPGQLKDTAVAVQWHPKYVHVLLPRDKVEEKSEEDGVINGVKRQLAIDKKESENTIKALDAKLEEMRGEVRDQIVATDAKIDAMKDDMTQQMTELKSLLRLALEPPPT